MAQNVTAVLEDDPAGGPAEQTIRSTSEGTGCEIELNAKNAATFSKQLAPCIAHARRAGRAHPRSPGPTAAGRQRPGDIRAWAKEHGLAVSARGRIPASVADQYNAASGRQQSHQPACSQNPHCTPGPTTVAVPARLQRGTVRCRP